jgi:hypothetical protein
MSAQNHELPTDVVLCRFLAQEGEPDLGWLDE